MDARAWLAGVALLLGFALSLPGPALAHKLNLFAAAAGADIRGEVYFAGGGKAADVPVTIRNAAGEVLAELRSAADGSFSYRATAPTLHIVVAETPDGHRAEWRIGADELAGAFAAGAGVGPATGPGTESAPAPTGREAEIGSQAVPPEQPAHAAQLSTALDPALTAAIEQAVARQVRPLREEAQAARDAAQFRDVLGGVGYIVGLAGLGLWWRCKRQGESR